MSQLNLHFQNYNCNLSIIISKNKIFQKYLLFRNLFIIAFFAPRNLVSGKVNISQIHPAATIQIHFFSVLLFISLPIFVSVFFFVFLSFSIFILDLLPFFILILVSIPLFLPFLLLVFIPIAILFPLRLVARARTLKLLIFLAVSFSSVVIFSVLRVVLFRVCFFLIAID